MQVRQLGGGGLTVSAIGLGCMGMSQSYGPYDDEESIRTMRHALDVGVTFFDTAAAYGFGENERLVGRAIRGRRHEVVLATKCGIIRGADGHPSAIDGSPGHIRDSCHASLERLDVETIDLFYLHRVDAKVPIEESVGAMAALVSEGKVRFLGLSEAAAPTLQRAHRTHPITALQSEYSLWHRDPERTVLPACRQLGIGFVPFSPIGRGFLAAAVRDPGTLAPDDLRRRLPRFQADNLAHNLTLVNALETFAARKACTPAQVALAWLLAQGPDIVPIPGTKRREYLDMNAAAANVTLTKEDLQMLDTAFPPDAAAGERYGPEMMRWIDKTPAGAESSTP
jgi:aryl-alcohol dehydrogenase-like predicted oxidoreductase